MEKKLIKERSFEFSLQVIELYKRLLRQNEYIFSKQLVRSATSIGANVEEASAGYSKRDFAAKMSIASKEAREALYWLRLLEASELIEYDFSDLKKECEIIIKILTSIVKTTQNNIKSNY